MKWDVGFFVKRVPSSRRVQSDRFRMVEIGEAGKGGFDQLCSEYPSLADFKRTSAKGDLFIAVLRVDGETESDAVQKAWELLGHAIDGFSLTCEYSPSVAPVLVLRKEQEANAVIREFGFQTWSTSHSTNSNAVQVWNDRCDKLLGRILPFYDVAVGGKWEAHTPLQQQIIYSARLFRIGCDIQSFGVEFLCKFAAVEGLVIGSHREGQKGKKLLDRIPRLLRSTDWDVAGTVKPLWEKRHLVAHEARGEFFPMDEGSFPYQLLTPRLDLIFSAIFVFSVDNMSKATTVAELWQLVDQYDVPKFVLQVRPKGMLRLAVSLTMIDRHEIWEGAGHWFEYVLGMDLAKFASSIPKSSTDSKPSPE